MLLKLVVQPICQYCLATKYVQTNKLVANILSSKVVLHVKVLTIP